MSREVIKSSQNKTIKRIKSLLTKKYRDEYGEFIIEGTKLLEEALAYDTPVAYVVFNHDTITNAEMALLLEKSEGRGITVLVVDEGIFKEISETQTPQGVMAVVKKPEYTLESIVGKEDYDILILDEIRDPGNMGTIIRTADACGLDAVILSKGCVDVYNGKSVRSTMGSLFHIPILTDVDIKSLIPRLHENGGHTIGADPYGSENCFELESHRKNAIIIGNEANGISDEVKSLMSHSVKIPMPGKAESLNAGIAAALMMYEIVVKREFKKKRIYII